MCTVASAPAAFRVRVWHLRSRGWDPWTERPLPEGVRVVYPLGGTDGSACRGRRVAAGRRPDGTPGLQAGRGPDEAEAVGVLDGPAGVRRPELGHPADRRPRARMAGDGLFHRLGAGAVPRQSLHT